MNTTQKQAQYAKNKSAKVGTRIACACGCGNTLIKKSYQQAFFNTRHKDNYWNTTDEKRRSRAEIYNKNSNEDFVIGFTDENFLF